MKNNRLLFRVHRQDWMNRLELHFACRTVGSDMLAVATNVEFETIPPDAMPPRDAPISMSPEEAAALMEELWNAGIRPPRCLTGNDERAALQAHIADLRRIVDALLPRAAA